MTTAVAAPPVTAALGPPTTEPSPSSRSYANIAPSSVSNGASTPNSKSTSSARPGSGHGSPSGHETPSRDRPPTSDSKRSPNSHRSGPAPKIIVKKEPTSPDIPNPGRHRPRNLDLSKSATSGSSLSARPSAPLTAKESAGLVMQDVGLACLSPGFHTQDPTMREQLQRSVDVRERQRQIIEARQKGQKIPHEGQPATADQSLRPSVKTPNTSRRKGPPPGLSISAPSAHQFANERVIQSAPLNQSFTGLRTNMQQPMPRQVVNQPSSLSHSSHIHHVPATQTNNRLPPIADVFAGESLAPGRYNNSSPGNPNHQAPLPSPGFPPSSHGHGPSQPPPLTSRPREYKSAEEAVQSLSGGREELLPRLVHYGGHQPPTPPSPLPGKGPSYPHSAHPSSHPTPNSYSQSESRSANHVAGTARRRGRDEYELDNGTPPLGRQERRTGPFGEGRDTPETQRRKKEEFIGLCSRAWDLFHS